jgi:hypothetical protein
VKNIILLSSTLFLLILSGLPLVVSAQSQAPPAQAKLPTGVKALCTNIAADYVTPTGIYNVKGGAFVEDLVGDIVWCAGGNKAPPLVAIAPSGSQDDHYYGMAGVSSTFGTVLVLANDGQGAIPPGFYICIGATSTGCFTETGYITLPSSYCSGLSSGVCYPIGMAMDSKLNVYYVDASNAIVAKCTYASKYQSCSTIEALTDQPESIYMDSKNNIWVTDAGCSGDVWLNGVLQYSLSDSLGGITISSANPSKTPHTYFAVNGGCGIFTYAFIYDVSDHTILPTPFSSPPTTDFIYGLSTGLQFTAYTAGNNVVYTVKDST